MLCDASEEGVCEGDVDEGCGDVGERKVLDGGVFDFLLVLADETSPWHEPAEGALDHSAPRQGLEAWLAIERLHHLDHEMSPGRPWVSAEGGLVGESGSPIGSVA